ncbi:MAG: toprim domain-containing protein [Nitrospirae bacterium]|nr:toprim domain-containing protein [Nitrospirota bacterium]
MLTESIIDALTLYNAGFKDVIPCYGVNGLTEDHLALFARHQTKEVYICFDRDDAGEHGAERIKEQLKEKNIDSYIITLPDTCDVNHPLPSGDPSLSKEGSFKIDINSFFSFDSAQDKSLTADAAAIFERLLKETNPRYSIRSDKAIKQEQKFYEKTDTGFTIQYGERRYELKGITKEGVKLKATIKAIKLSAIPSLAGKSSQPSDSAIRNPHSAIRFHLDTVDLYSNRSRLFFVKACAVLFTEKEELITEDITKLIDIAESWKPENAETTPIERMTKTEEEEALEFLKDTSLFNYILSDFETIGVAEPKRGQAELIYPFLTLSTKALTSMILMPWKCLRFLRCGSLETM